MAENQDDTVNLVLERQETAPAAPAAETRDFDQSSVLIGLAVVGVLAYAVYHLVGSKPSEKDGATPGLDQDPAERQRGAEGEGGEG